MTNLTPPITPLCFICKKPVNLENSSTDSSGKAAHEECYVLVLKGPTSGASCFRDPFVRYRTDKRSTAHIFLEERLKGTVRFGSP